MINHNAQLMIEEIIKIMRKLKFFTLEQLENELTIIPDSALKNRCVECIINFSEIEQFFGIYYFKFMNTEYMPNTHPEFQNN